MSRYCFQEICFIPWSRKTPKAFFCVWENILHTPDCTNSDPAKYLTLSNGRAPSVGRPYFLMGHDRDCCMLLQHSCCWKNCLHLWPEPHSFLCNASSSGFWLPLRNHYGFFTIRCLSLTRWLTSCRWWLKDESSY